ARYCSRHFIYISYRCTALQKSSLPSLAREAGAFLYGRSCGETVWNVKVLGRSAQGHLFAVVVQLFRVRVFGKVGQELAPGHLALTGPDGKIGRASCRERA